MAESAVESGVFDQKRQHRNKFPNAVVLIVIFDGGEVIL